MKKIIDHSVIGHIEYEESSWTGRKSLSINGKPVQKTSKKTFVTEDGVPIEVKGNYLTGANLIIGEEQIRLIPPIAWYEWVLSICLFLFVILWGNITALCRIVPIVGGAIGGLVCGVMFACSVIFSRMIKYPVLKIVVIVVMAGAAFLINFGIGSAIIALI